MVYILVKFLKENQEDLSMRKQNESKKNVKESIVTVWHFVFSFAIIVLFIFAFSGRVSKIYKDISRNRKVNENLNSCYSYIERNDPFDDLDLIRSTFYSEIDPDEVENYAMIEEAISNLLSYCDKSYYIADNHK